MEQNNSPDELIEIKPDAGSEDEGDVKIYKGPEKEHTEPVEMAESPAAEGTGISETEPVKSDAVSEEDQAAEPAEPEDDYAEDIAEMEHEEEDMQLVEAIGDSLTRQYDSELENSIIMIPGFSDPEIVPENNVPTDNGGKTPDEGETKEKKGNFFTRIPWWGYMIAGVAVVLTVMAIWVMTSGPGKTLLIRWGSRYAADRTTYEPVKPVDEADVADEKDDPGVDINRDDLEVVSGDHSVVTPEIGQDDNASMTGSGENDPNAPGAGQEQKIFNILLLGEENMGDSVRGRSDMMMIATINAEKKSVKLTSIMRDCLVSIPGHLDNRINVAYTIGGVSLLYETLKVNLGVTIDNYVLVNFDNFEDIIDALGGVDVNISAQEARYLNTTNYISDPSNRTLAAGPNHLNGNQTLGYCRIRAVATASNEYSDFGRTSRQRNVLNQIYSSAVNMGYFELLGVANKCLSYVKTDLTAEEIEKYLNLILEIGIDKGIENHRIPVSGTFSEALLRDMIVTKIDLQANADALAAIINGD